MDELLSTMYYTVFNNPLGWFGVTWNTGSGDARVVSRLTFGHPDDEQATEALSAELATGQPWPELVQRLESYARGLADSFLDVPVDLGNTTPFRRRVLECCRQIPHGQTITYAQLARLAGSAGASRAVGNCMAGNPIPLIIPCHRVVRSSGGLGGYSAVGGVGMKRRLLCLETE